MKLIDRVVATDVNNQIDNYIPDIEEKLAHLDKDELIKHFVSTEFNRFLSFYKNAPDLNVSGNSKTRKNERGERKQPNRGDQKNKRGGRTGHAEEGYTRFFINLGNEKGLQAHNLIGLINEYTRNRNIPVGKIDIMRKFSFFEVSSDFEADVLNGFKDAFWNGNDVNVEVSQAPGTKPRSRRRTSSRSSFSRDGSNRKRRSTGNRKRKNENSKKRVSGRSSGGDSSSFKGRFKEASKRRKRS